MQDRVLSDKTSILKVFKLDKKIIFILLKKALSKMAIFVPLRFRKAARVWCGGARESHVSQ